MFTDYIAILPTLALLVFSIVSLIVAIIAVVDFVLTGRDLNNCTEERSQTLFGKQIANFLVAFISIPAFLLFLIELVPRLI